MDIDARAFGRLEGEVKALTQMMQAQNRILESQNVAMEAMKVQMDSIRSTLSEARGGWKVLAAIGGASATAAAAASWVVTHLKGTP